MKMHRKLKVIWLESSRAAIITAIVEGTSVIFALLEKAGAIVYRLNKGTSSLGLTSLSFSPLPPSQSKY